MADPLNPLTEADLAKINQAIQQARDALSAADKASTAGIDVTAIRQTASDALNRLLAIKQVYFPGR